MKPSFFPVLIVLLLSCISFSFSQSEYSEIEWEKLKNMQLNGGVLERTTTKSGSAISKNVLYGRTEKGVEFNNGSLVYTTSNLDKGKRIGFTLSESRTFSAKEMKYAYYFYKNNTAKIVVNGEIVSAISYTPGDKLKIARQGKQIHFYTNETANYITKVDPFENLHVQTKILNDATPISNLLVDFETKRFEIQFSVTETNKINYSLSGATTPYKVTWCTGEKCLDNFIPSRPGTYSVRITDAYLNVFEREISIGNFTNWQDFDKSIATSGELTRLPNSGNGWGDARSTNVLPTASKWWAEYSINEQEANKSFGVIANSEELEKFTSLYAGFYITKTSISKVKVIYQGQALAAQVYNKFDVLKIAYDPSLFSLTWTINGRIVWRQKGVNISEGLRIAGLVRTGSTFNQIRYLSNEPETVETNFNDDTNLGSVTINLPSTTQNGPYHYKISENEINSLRDEFIFLRDTLLLDSLELDSVKFYTGSNTSLTHTFENLIPNNYYYAVFDSKGKRIEGGQIYLTPQIGELAGADVTITNSEILFTDINAYLESDLIWTENNMGSVLSYELTNNKVKQFLGFLESTVGFTDVSSFKYGVRIRGEVLKIIQEGALISNVEFRVRKNSIISYELIEQKLNVKLDEKLIHSFDLPEQYELKGTLYSAKPSSLYAKPYYSKKVYSYEPFITKGDCNGTSPSYGFSFKFLQQGNSINSFTLMNMDDLSVNNVIPNTAYILPAGTYTLNISYTNANGQTVISQETVYLGLAVEWAATKFYDIVGSDQNSVERSLATPTIQNGNLSEAISSNNLDTDISGWIYFQNYLGNTDNNLAIKYGPTNYLVLDDYPFITSNFPSSSTPYVQFVHGSSTVNSIPQGNSNHYQKQTVIVNDPSNNGPVIISNSSNADGYRLVRTTQNEVKLYRITYSGNSVMEQLLYTFNNFNSLFRLDVLSNYKNNGFYSVCTSFDCTRREPIIYAKLERKLTGVNYPTNNGNLYFFNSTEYVDIDGNLTYRIYDKNNMVVLSNEDQQIVNEYGDNRIFVDVSSLNSGAYILEVESQKNEKFYLRFEK